MVMMVESVPQRNRGERDWERLEARIRAGAERKGISLRQLGLAIGFSHAAVTEMLRYHRPMGRDLLIALADYFDESREEWQEMGGFNVSDLPWDRGWTTAERELARWFAGLTDEERAAVLEEARQRRTALDDSGSP